MANIPTGFAETAWHKRLSEAGLPRVHQGKVRDSYQLDEGYWLVVASDRISIFDFVLPALVLQKGQVLTALTVYWLNEVLSYSTRHHLLSFGAGIDSYLPKSLREDAELQRRAVVVKELPMLPLECIVRGYLTGSAWAAYRSNEPVCGHVLPAGLHDGALLPQPLFTPTTKSEVGHDLPLRVCEVTARYGQRLQNLSLQLYEKLSAHARSRGVILADTKFEFGTGLVLADEVGTPDSSRYWDLAAWQKCAEERKAPPSQDKEFVRQWGETVVTPFVSLQGEPLRGLKRLNPEDNEHVAFVHGLKVPDDILTETARLYHGICQRLTGQTLAHFWQHRMGIAPNY